MANEVLNNEHLNGELSKPQSDSDIHMQVIEPMAFELFSDLRTNPVLAGQRKFTYREHNGEYIGVFVDRRPITQVEMGIVYPEKKDDTFN